jgi:NodT family efflux transporter outer membrane factor (OMF) lipoprotein
VPSALTPADGDAGAYAATRAPDVGVGVFYPEPRLRALVTAALSGNRDLRVSYLSVLEARAQSAVARSERFPMLDAMGRDTVTGGGGRRTQESYTAELSLPGFDPDVFGRLRNMDESAYEAYLSSEEAWRAVRIALVSQVAESYLSWRLADQKEHAARKALDSYRDSLAFIERRIVSGKADLLDLEQARGQEDFARTRVASLKAERQTALNSLGLLTGDFSSQDSLPDPLDLSAWEPAGLSGEIPSEVLLARPDVLAAEHALKASHFDVGAARAAFFPKISLTGALGFMSMDLSELFAGPSGQWSFGPAVSVPLFAGGRNRANLDLAEIRRDKAVAQYELAVQTAFKEAADALLTRADLKGVLDASRRRLNTQRRVLALAEKRYLGGSSSYLEVLDAQREVLDAEMDYLDARKGYLSGSVSLYAALGGGLDPTGLPDPPETPGKPPENSPEERGDPQADGATASSAAMPTASPVGEPTASSAGKPTASPNNVASAPSATARRGTGASLAETPASASVTLATAQAAPDPATSGSAGTSPGSAASGAGTPRDALRNRGAQETP